MSSFQKPPPGAVKRTLEFRSVTPKSTSEIKKIVYGMRKIRDAFQGTQDEFMKSEEYINYTTSPEYEHFVKTNLFYKQAMQKKDCMFSKHLDNMIDKMIDIKLKVEEGKINEFQASQESFSIALDNNRSNLAYDGPSVPMASSSNDLLGSQSHPSIEEID